MPAAMAPDETRIRSAPARIFSAQESARAPMRSSSMPPSGVVREDEPTLTTTRRAVAMGGRGGGVSDHAQVPGHGPGLGQGFLDAEPGQPVGQEADRLVVAEVGLQHPAAGLLAADEVSALPGPDDLEVPAGPRLGPDDGPGRLG